MKIAVLTSLYPSPPSPFEGVFAERRWRGMADRGHSITVTVPVPLAPGPFLFGRWAAIRKMPREEKRHGIPVVRPRYFHVPGRARFNSGRFAKLGVRRILAGARPDVVVMDYAWPAAAAAPLLRERSIPCLVNGRGSDVLQVAGEAGLGQELAGFLVAANHWCAVSGDLVQAMDALAGRPGRGRLVPNGVDLQLFRPREREAARLELGLASQGPLVLVAGHLIERKDPLFALEVFAQGAPAGARMVYVGRGPLLRPLEVRIREMDLDDRVRVVGEVQPESLASWYAAADVLLLTSHREGRPNVVLEALASGRAVLATDVGGTRELLEPWSSRMLATQRDARAMGAMLASLLADIPPPAELRAGVQHLSWDRSSESLEAALEEAIEDQT